MSLENTNGAPGEALAPRDVRPAATLVLVPASSGIHFTASPSEPEITVLCVDSVRMEYHRKTAWSSSIDLA